METATKLLTYLNLTANETQVCEALLTHGAINGSQIAKLAKLDKSSAYRAATRLLDRGLIKRTGHKYDQKLLIDFMQLRKLIEQRQQEVQTQLSILDDLVKDQRFVSLAELLVDKIQVFQGEDANQRLIEDRFDKGAKLLRGFESYVFDTPATLPTKAEWQKLIDRRVNEGMHVHLLLDPDHPGTELTQSDPKLLKEVRRLPAGYKLATEINIYANRVSFYNRKSMHILGIIIEDESISELAANIYDFLWEYSTPV